MLYIERNTPSNNILEFTFCIMIFFNDSGTGPYNGAIWNKFSEQYQYQSIKKSTIVNAQ